MSATTLIDFAKKFIGVPYVFGGTTPKGFDCSGFVQYVYKHALGINISRTTKTQINDGREVSKNELQPGDLVFPTSDHVTLYIGNNPSRPFPNPPLLAAIGFSSGSYCFIRVIFSSDYS